MKNEVVFKKCPKCGALVEVIQDCTCNNCGISCCGAPMIELKANTVDCAIEKHKPIYEVAGDYIIVTVNHVMEEDHFIEFIALDCEKTIQKVFLQPGEEAKAIFPYVKNSRVYAYCNKHGLWSTDVN